MTDEYKKVDRSVDYCDYLSLEKVANSQVKSDGSLAYSDLIIELRSGEDGLEYAAADALWEQARQIVDLEAELQVSLHVNDQLRARVAELEAALKIYAEARCSGMICAFDDGEAVRAALGEKE
jgi:hypothetical protein